jgi:thiol-disulfide isomerase/thioredoxin
MALVFLLAAVPVSAKNGLSVLESPRSVADFDLPGTDGARHRLSEYRGRYLLVNFWAVWCGPCRREMPSMQRLYEGLHGERFELLAIHVGPSLEQASDYAGKLGLGFPILIDGEMALSDWQVPGLPTSFLLDPQGRIVARAVGERDWDDPKLRDRLRGLLAAEP